MSMFNLFGKIQDTNQDKVKSLLLSDHVITSYFPYNECDKLCEKSIKLRLEMLKDWSEAYQELKKENVTVEIIQHEITDEYYVKTNVIDVIEQNK